MIFERLGGCLNAPHHAVEVDGEYFCDAFLGDVIDWRRGGDAGVVDDDVEAPELRDSLLDRGEHAVSVGDIDVQCECSALLASQGFGNCACGRTVQVGDGDLEAVSVESLSNGLTNPLSTTGNECDFSVFCACHGIDSNLDYSQPAGESMTSCQGRTGVLLIRYARRQQRGAHREFPASSRRMSGPEGEPLGVNLRHPRFLCRCCLRTPAADEALPPL